MARMHFLFFSISSYFPITKCFCPGMSICIHLAKDTFHRTANSPMLLNLWVFGLFSFPNLYRQGRRGQWCHLWYCNNNFRSILDSSCRFKHWKTQQCLMLEKQHFTECRLARTFHPVSPAHEDKSQHKLLSHFWMSRGVKCQESSCSMWYLGQLWADFSISLGQSL